MIDEMAKEVKTVNVRGILSPMLPYYVRCCHGRHYTRLACLPANAHQGRCTDGVSVWYEFVGQCPDCGQLYRVVTTPCTK